jgi:predicted alpha/beta-fold hydrolase
MATCAITGDFRPLPFLGNPHVQTLLGNLLPAPRLRYPTREHIVRLADGDGLMLHDTMPPNWRPGGRIALLVHGLGGSHRSGYMRRVAKLLLPHGLRVVCMDLRGCGRGLPLARRPYHGGCSDDVRAAVTAIRTWDAASRVTLIGFSLGGNIVLKLAGEAAERSVDGLERVAALAPPADFERCAALLAAPRNRFYEQYFVRGLLEQVGQRRRFFPEDAAIRFPRRLTMRQFDDLYTSPRCGFDDATHYYRSAACLPLLEKIAVPTFILTARDDPFIAAEPLERLATPPNMEVLILDRGGHLGFLGRGGAGGFRWAEQRIAEWVIGTSG